MAPFTLKSDLKLELPFTSSQLFDGMEFLKDALRMLSDKEITKVKEATAFLEMHQ